MIPSLLHSGNPPPPRPSPSSPHPTLRGYEASKISKNGDDVRFSIKMVVGGGGGGIQ